MKPMTNYQRRKPHATIAYGNAKTNRNSLGNKDHGAGLLHDALDGGALLSDEPPDQLVRRPHLQLHFLPEIR